jgi:hypothetical protein
VAAVGRKVPIRVLAAAVAEVDPMGVAEFAVPVKGSNSGQPDLKNGEVLRISWSRRSVDAHQHASQWSECSNRCIDPARLPVAVGVRYR